MFALDFVCGAEYIGLACARVSQVEDLGQFCLGCLYGSRVVWFGYCALQVAMFVMKRLRLNRRVAPVDSGILALAAACYVGPVFYVLSNTYAAKLFYIMWSIQLPKDQDSGIDVTAGKWALVKEGYKCNAVPPKKLIGSFNPDFILKREKELSAWLLQVCESPASSSEALKSFLLEYKEPRMVLPPTDVTVNQVPRPPPAVPTNVAVAAPPSDTATDEELEKEIEDEIALYNTPKTSIDDFELLKVIGKGSYGKVTLVRKKDNSKLFAMKTLNKSNVKRRNQVEHTRTERRVLGFGKHPYIVHLHYAFQTKQKLYFVIDYCPGGELFFHLSRMERFPEPMAMVYAAEITLALDHLHSLGVVYRPNAQSLIAGLLNRNPVDRLGNATVNDIKTHPFFATIDWDKLMLRQVPAPFNPCATLASNDETKNFEADFTKMQLHSVPDASNMQGSSYRASMDARNSMTFQGFTYNTPSDLNDISERNSTLTQF
ncbi:hypothetical protein DYB32_008589 [Aphanomyces invadans]|uniref:AGC protein kinase n=1 Tax=Aphanomyces invadans TaxID=157072 RepID=A0A418AKL9_9STRA|nr:hypothetical protein DYB32_008589 [Aphanomyces invadans]